MPIVLGGPWQGGFFGGAEIGIEASATLGVDRSASASISIGGTGILNDAGGGGAILILPALPNNNLFLSFVTGAPTTYTVNDQPAVGGNFSPDTVRDAMNCQLGSGGNREIQYEPGMTGIMARDVERYVNGTQSGINPTADGYSDLVTPSTANDAEWNTLIGKHLNNVLTRRSSSGNVEQYYMPDTQGACRYLGIDAVGHANLALQSPATVQYSDVEGKEFNAPGSPLYAERVFGDTFTDADGVVQMKADNDLHSAALRSVGNFCRAVGNKLLQSDQASNFISRDHRMYGYGQTSGSQAWNGASAGTQTFPDQTYSGETYEWAIPYIEAILWDMRNHLEKTNPNWQTIGSGFPEVPNRTWPAEDGVGSQGYRWAPFITGPISGAAILIMEAFQLNGLPGSGHGSAHVDDFLVGTNGQTSLYQVLEDFVLWAETSTTHPNINDAWAVGAQPMFTLNTSSGSGYKQFRFQDRAGGGEGRPDAISMWFADAYAWCGKQRALGNATLGVTQNLALAQQLFDVYDQCFADAVTRKPFLQSYFGGFERKELGEIWNGCLKGWFWRLEAQGIDTGRRWIA